MSPLHPFLGRFIACSSPVRDLWTAHVRSWLKVCAWFLGGAVLSLSVGNAAADQATKALLDPLRYETAAAAQAAWRPMQGGAQAMVGVVAGREALRLPCRFSGSDAERVYWDRKVKMDLADCRGVAFEFFCANLEPIGQLNVYFQSGAGWYNVSFQPERVGGWCRVTIDKSEARTEGNPEGWGAISTMRISAWKGSDGETEMCIADLRRVGVLGIDATVAVVRPKARDEGKPVRKPESFVETVAEELEACGVDCSTVAEEDLTRDRLRGASLVVLPHNPQLSEEAARAIREYLEQDGGRILVFYTLPANLRSIVRIETAGLLRDGDNAGRFASIRKSGGGLAGAPEVVEQRSWNISDVKVAPEDGSVVAEWYDAQGKPTGKAAIVATKNCVMMSHVLLKDDLANKRRLLLAMAGRAAPALWGQSVEKAMDRIGRDIGVGDFEATVKAVERAGSGRPEVKAMLDEAILTRGEAKGLQGAGKYAEALACISKAERKLVEAHCRAQKAQPGEFRGFWCHSAFGVQGMDWDEAIRRLSEAGFTAILPNMLWGGVAFFESEVLPVSPEVAKRGDQITACLAACRKYGIQIHVWKVNWNTGRQVPQAFLEKMRKEGRLQMSSKGKEEPWLCPSHLENRKLEIAAMVEVATKYEVDGVHFDYIRYPDNDHCYCPGCRERFAQAQGVQIAQWPKDVMRGGSLQKSWLDWRRKNIDAVVSAVSEKVRATKPQVKISAAVFRNWATDRDGVGQDWKLWCERGWVDFLCPMDYTESDRLFESWVMQQKALAGKVPIYPGIGVSTSRTRLPVAQTIRQIEISRKHGTGGFTVFNYGVSECRDLLPLLGSGVTAKTK